MIAPYIQAAVVAPLATRPNHLEAEIRYIAARDHVSLFSAALEQWYGEPLRHPELFEVAR